jgi:hypothetical protein
MSSRHAEPPREPLGLWVVIECDAHGTPVLAHPPCTYNTAQALRQQQIAANAHRWYVTTLVIGSDRPEGSDHA